MSTGFEHDPHSEQGHDCPRNVFGITSYRVLQPIEAAYVIKRGGELEDAPVTGSFDPNHLRTIHRYLFQDVFPWAGEYRVVNISKTTSFGMALYVASALQEALGKLKKENFLRSLDRHTFVSRAAFYLGEINAIHPFREGNGRTQREFIRQLASQAGYPLVWAGISPEQNIAASILSHSRGDNSGLATIIEGAMAQAEISNREE